MRVICLYTGQSRAFLRLLCRGKREKIEGSLIHLAALGENDQIAQYDISIGQFVLLGATSSRQTALHDLDVGDTYAVGWNKQRWDLGTATVITTSVTSTSPRIMSILLFTTLMRYQNFIFLS